MARLITKDEAKRIMECEECGLVAPKRPWPTGWSECGRSRRRVYSDAISPGMRAFWCPEHRHKINDHPIVRDKELRLLRERLRAEIYDASTKWSARREGLIPMPEVT